MRACCRRSMPAMREERSAIVTSGLLRCCGFTVVRRRRQEKPPASPLVLAAASAPRFPCSRGAQLLDAADARCAETEQAVDMAALEQVDAERLAHRYGGLVVAPAHDRAGAPEAGDQLAELIAAGFASAAQHVGVPHDLDEIEPEPLAVDEGQGEIGDAVEADAVAALPDEIAREDIGAEIGEDVDRLQLEDDGAARRRLEIGVEADEAGGEQRRDGEIDAERAGDGA